MDDMALVRPGWLGRALDPHQSPSFAGVVGKPTVICHHAKGGFLGLSRVDYCTATYESGAAYHCRVWNPDMGVGDAIKCNPTPFRKGHDYRARAALA